MVTAILMLALNQDMLQTFVLLLSKFQNFFKFI